MGEEIIRFQMENKVWSQWLNVKNDQPAINALLYKANVVAVETKISMTKEEYLDFMDKFK